MHKMNLTNEEEKNAFISITTCVVVNSDHFWLLIRLIYLQASFVWTNADQWKKTNFFN